MSAFSDSDSWKKKHDFAGPQSEFSISELENLLDVQFPKSYRDFLSEYGGGFGFSGIYANNPQLKNPGTVYGDTIRMREQYHLPNHYFVISESPLGGICCLDVSIKTLRNENPIVQFAFGPNSQLLHRTQVADNFQDYLIDILRTRLEVLREESDADFESES